MSQIFNASISGGNVPVNVPTTFQTDNTVAGTPSATTSNNIIIIDSSATIQNNSNGITTRTGTDADGNALPTNEVLIELTNRSTIAATTSDGLGQLQQRVIFAPSANKGLCFTVDVVGYDINNNVMTGGEIVGVARSDGVTVTVIGLNDVFDQADANANPLLDMTTADYDIIASGANLDIQFTGIATKTISWKATFTYIQSP